MAERTFRDGARAVGPLAVAVVGFGISFGVLARAVGFGWLAPIVMSTTTFAGSAQFASVSVLGDGGTVAAAVAAALLLNARYAPIGISVAP
jgi:predicted branched-subunit amino acid permease